MPQGILDRYGQVLPTFIFSETEVVYLGKSIDVLPKVKEIANDLSSKGLRHVVLLPSIKTGLEATQEIIESVFLGSVIYDIVIREFPKCPPSGRLCQRSLRLTTAAPSCLNNYRSISHCIFSTRLERRAHQSVLSMVQGYEA